MFECYLDTQYLPARAPLNAARCDLDSNPNLERKKVPDTDSPLQEEGLHLAISFPLKAKTKFP